MARVRRPSGHVERAAHLHQLRIRTAARSLNLVIMCHLVLVSERDVADPIFLLVIFIIIVIIIIVGVLSLISLP
jgi:hypothetical protein